MNIKKFFDKIEERAIKKGKWIVIPGSNMKYFYVDLMTYKGKDLLLEDGTKIIKGNIVGELHVNNNNMPEVTFKTLKIFSRNIDQELTLLAQSLNVEAFKSVQAFFGRTLLYPIVAKKGFQVMEIQSFGLRIFINIWDLILRKIYAKNPVQNSKNRKSKEIWISRSALLKKLGEVYNEKENY